MVNAKKAAVIVGGALAAMIALSTVATATEVPHGPRCSFDAASSSAASDISGDSLANAVAQAPIGGNNAANVGNCSEFLNDNLNGNLSGNDVSVLSGLLP